MDEPWMVRRGRSMERDVYTRVSYDKQAEEILESRLRALEHELAHVSRHANVADLRAVDEKIHQLQQESDYRGAW